VAPTNRAVLICGPTGAGKEVIARLIHRLSSNPDTPFIDINCGSIPEHLIEAEFFGHTKGAFTGAVANRVGYFELAGAGTLFLDEIGELPLSLQPKLLRVLEMRTFRPVGSTEVRHFRGRIVAATHRDLQALVAGNTFREDLYYRLANFVLDIPGLDQRKEDIPALVSHFVSLQARQIGAGLRLGQIHGAGPFAGDQIGQIGFLLRLRNRPSSVLRWCRPSTADTARTTDSPS